MYAFRWEAFLVTWTGIAWEVRTFEGYAENVRMANKAAYECIDSYQPISPLSREVLRNVSFSCVRIQTLKGRAPSLDEAKARLCRLVELLDAVQVDGKISFNGQGG